MPKRQQNLGHVDFDEWLAVPLFDESRDERLERAAASGWGPVRLAARGLLACEARFFPRRASPGPSARIGAPAPAASPQPAPAPRRAITARQLQAHRRRYQETLLAVQASEEPGADEDAWDAYAATDDAAARLTTLLGRRDSLLRTSGRRVRRRATAARSRADRAVAPLRPSPRRLVGLGVGLVTAGLVVAALVPWSRPSRSLAGSAAAVTTPAPPARHHPVLPVPLGEPPTPAAAATHLVAEAPQTPVSPLPAPKAASSAVAPIATGPPHQRGSSSAAGSGSSAAGSSSAPPGSSSAVGSPAPPGSSSAVGSPAAPSLANPPSAIRVAAAAHRAPLPVGMGMWIWQPSATDGGEVAAIVRQATQAGLTHLYVPTGSSADGLVNLPFLDQLVPAAHAAGLKVVGWDRPTLTNVGTDVARAMQAIDAPAPGGQHIDALAADVEPGNGADIDAATVAAYAGQLRQAAGDQYPLIAVVPQPAVAPTFPYAPLLRSFDAVAPVVQWVSPASAPVQTVVAALAAYGKPVTPVGEAFGTSAADAPAAPSAADITRFIGGAEQAGAIGVSFWSWQAATARQWAAIGAEKAFSLPAAILDLGAGQLRALQAELSSLGYPVGISGQLDQATVDTLAKFQQAAGLPATGVLDQTTQQALLSPVPLG